MAGKRFNVYFTMRTWERLVKFVEEKYGGKQALSLTIEEAVKAYLARHRREV